MHRYGPSNTHRHGGRDHLPNSNHGYAGTSRHDDSSSNGVPRNWHDNGNGNSNNNGGNGIASSGNGNSRNWHDNGNNNNNGGITRNGRDNGPTTTTMVASQGTGATTAA
jgi:hypothetical protein